MKQKPISPVGDSWDDFEKEFFTSEEIELSNIRCSLINEIQNLRNLLNLTQKELEEKSGVKQPVIARLENGITDPQLSTVLKLLQPLQKKLAIVPIDYEPEATNNVEASEINYNVLCDEKEIRYKGKKSLHYLLAALKF